MHKLDLSLEKIILCLIPVTADFLPGCNALSEVIIDEYSIIVLLPRGV